MRKNYTEQELRETLGQEMQTSREVDERLETVYQQIRAGEAKQKRGRGERDMQSGRRMERDGHVRRIWYRVAGTTAAILAAGIFCVSNPALAAKLPFIGHIFEEIGDESPYPGDYSAVGTALMTENTQETNGGENTQGVNDAEDGSSTQNADSESAAATSQPYTQQADGLTVTLSEVYCNELALYLTMELKSEEPFAERFAMYGDAAWLQAQGTIKTDFTDGETFFLTYLNGKQADNCTYLAMCRIDKDTMLSAYGGSPDVQLPDTFEAEFAIDCFFGNRKDYVSIYEAAGVETPTEEELAAMTDEECRSYMQELYAAVPEYNTTPNQYENAWYEGPFSFDLSVAVDDEQTVTVAVDEETDDLYVASVTRTPFELYLDLKNMAGYDGILQVLDADGKVLDTGANGGMENLLAIDGHDVSRIDIYYISFEDFENRQIKGSYFDEHETNEQGQTLKEVLEECCIYHREVELG